MSDGAGATVDGSRSADGDSGTTDDESRQADGDSGSTDDESRSTDDESRLTDDESRSTVGDSWTSTGGLLAGAGDRTVLVLAIFALGQVVVTATLPAWTHPGTIAAEALLLGLLVVPFAGGPAPVRSVAAVLIGVAGLGALAWGTFALTDSLWLVALVTAGVATPVAYYLHRYGRVVAGRYGDVRPAR